MSAFNIKLGKIFILSPPETQELKMIPSLERSLKVFVPLSENSQII